jgi:PTS system nitrogen regulatory IIA component
MEISPLLNISAILTDQDGGYVHSKKDALRLLASKLSSGDTNLCQKIEKGLWQREEQQSTGIGDGVAIPHAFIEGVEQQRIALILSPKGVEFESIDAIAVTIMIGVIGPPCSTGTHLKILARLSRLLRSGDSRAALLASETPEEAYEWLIQQEKAL